MTYKKCLFCNQSFIPKVAHQKFCCIGCKRSNYGKENEAKRQRELYHRQGKVKNECKHCGKEYDVVYKNRKRSQYCSIKCALETQDKRGWQHKTNHGVAQCPACHKEFTRHNKRHKYCSKKCIPKRVRPTKWQPQKKVCIICAKGFIPKTSIQKYCSKECAKKEKLKCKRCGKIFIGNKGVSYCSLCKEKVIHRGSIRTKCPTCGKEFWRPLSAIAKDEKTYCSKRCVPRWISSDMGWRPDIGLVLRSRWEANFARVLLLQRKKFEYEKEFSLSNSRKYLPDFTVDHTVYEIKGRAKRLWKVKEFIKMYPEYKMVLVGKRRDENKGRFELPIDIYYEDLEAKYKDKLNVSKRFIGWEDSELNRRNHPELFARQLEMEV